jgi:hypothetical protein
VIEIDQWEDAWEGSMVRSSCLAELSYHPGRRISRSGELARMLSRVIWKRWQTALRIPGRNCQSARVRRCRAFRPRGRGRRHYGAEQRVQGLPRSAVKQCRKAIPASVRFGLAAACIEQQPFLEDTVVAVRPARQRTLPVHVHLGAVNPLRSRKSVPRRGQ